jgi:hypothetical protein
VLSGNCPGYPNELSPGSGSFGEVNKVLILADNNAFFRVRVPADVGVKRVTQASLENVLAIETAVPQVLREGGGELVIDEEFHDAGSTTWSV